MENNTILIDRYLQGEMSAEEKNAFENKLSVDKNLREELNIQQQIIKAAETAGLKNEFGKAIKKRIFAKQLFTWGTVIVLIIAIIIFFVIKNDLFSHGELAQRDGLKKGIERFEINNSTDTIIETNNGVVFAIPANAFSSNSKNIQIEVKTALNANDIMQNGLSTMSNGDMLQTAGMFYINGYDDGKQLSLVKDIAVSVPTDEINPAMQLFDGVEDSSGHVNWVNPKPVEKKLRTYDITTLDFYPPDYILTLKGLQKNYRDKKYTDSLYYSFSGYSQTIPQDERANNTPEDTVVDKVYIIPDSSNKRISDLSANAIDSSNDYVHYEIDPARIRALWDKKFNNTIIATKEFEERLKYIHSLCSSRYLEAYLEGINMPLYKVDQVIADNSSGEIKKKFLEFAARKDGGVIIADGLQKQLSEYFQKKYLAYKEAVAKTNAKYEAELTRFSNIADEKRRKQATDDFVRENKNFEEEFCINLTNAYQQIGINRNCRDTIIPPAQKYYNVTISTTGWKNLDVYVFEATANRESMTYTDPVTGKTATLTYKEISITIENLQQYDRVFVFLVPDSLSSFQRMQQEGNIFKEKLNSLFRYDAVLLAFKGTQAYFSKHLSMQPTNYTFSLLAITDEALRSSLANYSFTKTKALRAEFEYQLFEQQEVIRQLQLQKDMEFRKQVAWSIFNCGEERQKLMNK